MTNDFTLEGVGGENRRVQLYSRDTEGWKITFVDTGLHSNIGQRLLRVRRYLEGEEMFLANYADGLSDLPLDELVADFERRDAIGVFAAVRSAASFHAVQTRPDGVVVRIGPMPEQDMWINGGFFAFRKDIFRYINEGEELVEQPFSRLIAEHRLAAFRWAGFWQAMDTFKDKISFDRMEARGHCPWMTWARHPANGE